MSERAPTPTLRTADFDYHLPAELIAQEPVAERGRSRLLHVDRASGKLADRQFPEIATLIPAGDVLCVNSSRVRHARLRGTRPSGAPAEILLIAPAPDGDWLAMGRPGSALQPGKHIRLGDGAEVVTKAIRDDGLRVVRFVGLTSDEAMQRFGTLPLPPYITREAGAIDEARYQTVYAKRAGSVAAPTAGLHFTDELLDALVARGVAVADIDLEVGPGTFRPVESDDFSQHQMHEEHFDISPSAAELIRGAHGRRAHVWAVGTTVVRALESRVLECGSVTAGAADTRLMITPGFRFSAVDRLITNFHLPRSTLMMLVAAFAGYDLVMRAYQHAITERYRFYSYGDAMLIT